MKNLNEQSASWRKEQFGRIYDEYIEKIYRFVYLKVNSQEIAEDLTSKVFTKGWEAYNSEIKNQGAFLYQIARNMVIDHYRQKGRTNIVFTDLSEKAIDEGTGLHEKAVLNADIEAVKQAISNIKKDYQDIVIWHYIDGLTVDEISKIMAKPAGTVRVMLHRGLKALKEECNKSGSFTS